MASNQFFARSTPVFTGENYQLWAIKMKAYLKALSLWKVVERELNLAPLVQNPTLAQMKKHEEYVARNPKPLTYIMTWESPKQVCDKLKEEFECRDRVKTVK